MTEHKTDFWTEALAQDLRRFFLGKLKCTELAAEFTHDTYLHLQKALERETPRSITAMAFRIAVNLVIDHQRKIQVREQYQTVDVTMENLEQIPAATYLQPEHILTAQQKYQSLQAALLDLSAQHRTAFYLKSMEGVSYAEIAVKLGVSRSTVNNLLAETMRHCLYKCRDN